MVLKCYFNVLIAGSQSPMLRNPDKPDVCFLFFLKKFIEIY